MRSFGVTCGALQPRGLPWFTTWPTRAGLETHSTSGNAMISANTLQQKPEAFFRIGGCTVLKHQAFRAHHPPVVSHPLPHGLPLAPPRKEALVTLDALIATLSSTGALYQDSVALLVPEAVEMALATGGEQLQRMVKEVGLAKLVGLGLGGSIWVGRYFEQCSEPMFSASFRS